MSATHVVETKTYIRVLAALMALLVITVVFSWIDFDRFLPFRGWNTAFAIAIAVMKASLILAFFMHLKYGPRLTWAFAGAGFVWLGIMLTLTMTDYMTRNKPPGASPKGEPEFLLPSAAYSETGNK